jgi:hypothetical protein
MSTVRGGQGNIITNGLVLNLDAANPRSYIPPFNGTIWNDLSGNGYNGSLINGPTFDSANGGSIVFDGVDDSTNFGDILDLGTNNCTINIWLKINSSWPSSFRCPLSKALFASQSYRYAVFITQTRQLACFLQGNSGTDRTPSTVNTLNLNQWYMCTVVINRASTIQLYINSIPQTLTGNATISQWNGLNFQSPNPFRVGSYTFSDNITTNLNFPGNISQTLMYFRSLSEAEILQNFNATRARFGI